AGLAGRVDRDERRLSGRDLRPRPRGVPSFGGHPDGGSHRSPPDPLRFGVHAERVTGSYRGRGRSSGPPTRSPRAAGVTGRGGRGIVDQLHHHTAVDGAVQVDVTLAHDVSEGDLGIVRGGMTLCAWART